MKIAERDLLLFYHRRLFANVAAAVVVGTLSLTFAIAIPGPMFAADIVGTVTHIVDGDTFDIANGSTTERIRLCGIDSPERGVNGYKEAKAKLKSLIRGHSVRCVRIDEGSVCDGRSKRKSGNRIVAQCFLGGTDIGILMVRARFACDYPKHSGGYYQQVGVINVCARQD